MLKIWVNGFRNDCIKNPGAYFNIKKKKEWFNRADIKRVIHDIDNTEAVKDEYLESPVFGAISPDRLSHGCKTVILLYVNPTCNVYASRCGDNCFESILSLAKNTDVIITLHHIPTMPEEVHAVFLDSGVEVHNRKEFVLEYGRVTGHF